MNDSSVSIGMPSIYPINRGTPPYMYGARRRKSQRQIRRDARRAGRTVGSR